MIIINYMKDGNKYRIWLPNWPGDTFDVISRDKFKFLLDTEEYFRIFQLVDCEYEFMNAGSK